MSDLMLLGVLRAPMPPDPDPITLGQLVGRAHQAADRIEADEALLRQALGALERSKFELRGITPTQDIDETIAALRGRLGEKA